MPDDKKKQAMSLLFGDAPARPESKPAASPVAAKDVPARPVAKTAARARSTSVAKAPERSGKGVGPSSRSENAPLAQSPPQGNPEGDRTPDPYYQGASRYRRASGEQVKHSVYLDPDVSQAIKVAAAMGDDSRGSNVSAIVNEALRELGYGGG